MLTDEPDYAIEAILFSSRHPVSIKKLSALTGATQAEVKSAAGRLEIFYTKYKRAFHIANVAGGLQLRTDAKFFNLIAETPEIKTRKFSQAALEVMSIVAYKQPVSRAIIEGYRTVDSGYAIKSLLEKDLIRIIRRDISQPGHPIIYGTTDYFLEVFGFDRISELPPTEDLNLPDEENVDETAEAVEVSADMSIIQTEKTDISTPDDESFENTINP